MPTLITGNIIELILPFILSKKKYTKIGVSIIAIKKNFLYFRTQYESMSKIMGYGVKFFFVLSYVKKYNQIK